MRIIVGILLCSLGLINDAMAQRSVINQMRLSRPIHDSTVNYVFKIPENEDYDYFVGAFSSPISYLNGVLNNDLFYERNDSLFTRHSFDYEGALGIQFLVAYSTSAGLDTAMVKITDVTGKWDTDGLADSDIALKYPRSTRVII
ncbi:MAG: hypothetical protein U5L96_10840 [Owenweeksia sp.]|nr:hypothetical protein [Owenweeksia sp.]